MAVPIDKPMVCPVLIGRDAHLEALLRCLEQAKAGLGQTVLVTGEGGIGKSRLVAEAKPAAERAGFLILQGTCFEPDRSLPYAPILDLLRASCASSDAAARIATAVPELRTLLPELTGWLPDGGPKLTFTPEHEKHRLFAALERFFAEFAAPRPVLVIIEDVHWSDEASLEFFFYLARRLVARPILLLLTYRSDEIHEGLRRLLAELDRARLAAEIRLTRLSAANVDAMLRAIFALHHRAIDHQPSGRAGFVSAISALTEGNPFFVEEVVRSLLSADAIPAGDESRDWSALEALPIPRSVDDAVRRRAARVSLDARHVLTVAAVAGRRFEFPLLQAVTDRDESSLLLLIKELIAAGLVVEESAEQFAFRHALTRQAIYTGLLAQERKALHREIAETMEQLESNALELRQADLAYHHYGAGHWSRALAYSRRAGETAQRLHAPRTAIEHFTRALEAADRLIRPHPPGLYSPPVHDRLPADLYLGRGRAHEITGDYERARADYETALRSAELTADQRAKWQVLMALGLLWAERDYERTGDYYRRASDLAEALADPGLQASSLNRLGNWLANIGRPKEALDAHQQALALVAAQRDERAIAETLDLIGMAYGIAHGDTMTATVHFARASERFRALGDLFGLASSLTSYATFSCPGFDEVLYSPLMTQDDCARLLGEALSLARQVEWLGGQAHTEFAWSRALTG